jgi:hypothetical protein
MEMEKHEVGDAEAQYEYEDRAISKPRSERGQKVGVIM